nr:hypothetical protein CDL15_Pgr027500 [Ipomoea trifida]
MSKRMNVPNSLSLCLAAKQLVGAYDPLDPTGNITIKWDVMSWTPDGYVNAFSVLLFFVSPVSQGDLNVVGRLSVFCSPVFCFSCYKIFSISLVTNVFSVLQFSVSPAVVTMNNFQMFRHILSPGWTLGWTWAKKEVIWTMVGAQTTDQGDCSKFKGSVPHCCKTNPTVVDLLPGVPYNQQFSNCCKGGVLASWGQDPQASVSAFQVSVGQAGTSNKTVKLPKNFTLLGPGPGYTCGPAKIVPSTKSSP